MYLFLNGISVIATYLAAICVIYYAFNLVVGWMPFMNQSAIGRLRAKDILFVAGGTILLLATTTFHLPW